MLRIYTKSIPEGCIVRVTPYFNLHKEKEWFADPFVKKVIKDIDDCIAVKDEYIESPIWGGMSPERLSTGVKALILMRMLPGANIYATKCGDNCASYIIELSKMQDVTITLQHSMPFHQDFDAIMMETGKEVHTLRDYLKESLVLRGVIKPERLGGR